MMQDGEFYPLPMPSGLLALRASITSASESGLSLPTPCVPNGGRTIAHAEQVGKSFYHKGKKVQLDLHQAVKRLPTLHGMSKDGRSNGPSGNELGRAVNRMATVTVQDSKNNGAPSQMKRNSKPLNAEVGGSLNPPWVEWLMGWPLGWTDCAHSATAKFRQWLYLHGASYLK